MKRRLASALATSLASYLALASLSCAPASETEPPNRSDHGLTRGAVSAALSVETSGVLVLVELTLATDRIELQSDREPDEAARLRIEGELALDAGFDDDVLRAPPGTYSVFELVPLEDPDTPALRLVVQLADVRVTLEASGIPQIRMRCPTPVDLSGGATLDVAAVLDLTEIETALDAVLFPPPVDITDIRVTEETHPALIADVLLALQSSWSLTCSLR